MHPPPSPIPSSLTTTFASSTEPLTSDPNTPPGGMSELQKLVNMQPQVMSSNLDEKLAETASESG